MYDLTADRFPHLRNKIFPSLWNKTPQDNTFYIQERDYRLALCISDLLAQNAPDGSTFTLEEKTRALKVLDSQKNKQDLEGLISMIRNLREWGIVHEGNEFLPMLSILFNWANESLLYATLNSPNNKELENASLTIMHALSVLHNNFSDYKKYHGKLLKAVKFVHHAILDSVPDKELHNKEYMERFHLTISAMDSKKKRWAYSASPYLIEHWNDQKSVPYSSSKEGFYLLHRKFAIDRHSFESMVPKHCATTLNIWKRSTSLTLNYLRQFQIDRVQALMKEGYTPKTNKDQDVIFEYVDSLHELNQTLKANSDKCLSILQSIIKNPSIGEPETQRQLNPLGNITANIVRVATRLLNIHNEFYDTIDTLGNLEIGSTSLLKEGLDAKFFEEIGYYICYIGTLNELVAPIFGWSLAAEQQPVGLDEKDKLEFLPPSLKKKKGNQAAPKALSKKEPLSKRKIALIPAPKKNALPQPAKQAAKKTATVPEQPPKSIKPPVAKKMQPGPILSLPSTEKAQTALHDAAPSLDMTTETEPRETRSKVSKQPLFSTLADKRHPELVKAAAHADLDYSLLKGLSQINAAVDRDRSNELLFISRTALFTSNLFIEAGIKLASLKKGIVAKGNSHNLWTSFKGLQTKIDSPAIARHYLGSYWTRFMREQIEKWNLTAHNTPKLLKNIVDIADSAPDALAKTQRKVEKWIAESIAFNNELIEKVYEEKVTLPIYTAAHIQAAKRPEPKDNPWAALISKVENLPSEDNVWIKQWLDELRALHGAWRLIGEAKTPESHALMVSAVHGLLHASVQAPLYALQKASYGDRSTEHRLNILWKAVFDQDEIKFPGIVGRLLNDASVASRYPYESDKPRSDLHRLQLEAITVLARPETVLENRGEKEDTADSSFNFAALTPDLNRAASVDLQKHALKEACRKIAKLLDEKILDEVQKRISNP